MFLWGRWLEEFHTHILIKKYNLKNKSLLIKLILLLIVFSCSKESDDVNSDLFLLNHVGTWETTFQDLEINVAIEITSNSAKTFSKSIYFGCYQNSSNISGGILYVETHTKNEYTGVYQKVPVSNLFTGSDLEYLTSQGISLIDIAFSYQTASEDYISFAEIYYEAGTFNEIVELSGLFGKIDKIVKC